MHGFSKQMEEEVHELQKETNLGRDPGLSCCHSACLGSENLSEPELRHLP